MNSLDLIKALSYIDDDLVFDAANGKTPPQTAGQTGRIKQPKPNKPPRGGAKTKTILIGAVAVVLCAAIVCMVLYFTGVFGGKQVPIYTGMEISSTNSSASSDGANAVSYKYSGDYTGRGDDIDKDNPFGNGSLTIEQQAESTLEILSAGEDIYYADAGEDIYVKINFDNPDEYDIVSFVLTDGTTTTRYGGTYGMFESGSNYDQIIIKLNVGNTGGIIEYTISEIKYLDDNSVNSDVIIGGETVVRCGVRVSGMTTASVTDETVTLTSISFTVNIVDKYSLIAYSGYAKAILYDGESITEIVDLELGENSVVFDGLTPDTIYQYAIVAYYDDLSGGGAALNYLYTDTVYTPAIVLFDEEYITIDQESITFAYSWYEGYSGGITSLTLTGGGETKTLDAQTTSITGLLSDNDYVLTATYAGTNGETSTITLEFTTEAKATPEVEINAEATQETISYELAITDTDNVGSLTSVMLSLNGEVVQTLTTSTGAFSNLLSNNTYTITALYTYDLNDGKGEQTAEYTREITTLAKATPEVEITVTDSTVSSLTFNVNYTDIDGVGRITAIGLYNGDTLVKSETNFSQVEYIYSDLSSYTEYTLKVTYTYDLNDGEGAHTIVDSLTKYTDPVVTVNSVSYSGSVISVGDTIYITASVYNPSGVTYNSVVVNGVTYTTIGGSKGSTLYIDILNNGQFAGGYTTLTITQINCTIDGNSYTIDITENNTVTVFINGELTIDDFYIASLNESGEYEEIHYCYPEDEIYYVISFSNAKKYIIYSITIGDTVYNSEDIIMSDDYQTVYILANSSMGTELTSISYSNSYGIDETLSLSFETSFLLVPTCSETVEIYTAEDFVEKIDGTDSGYKYYILMNDIDLSDYKWVNRNNVLYGVFDGNGYTISGVGAKYTYENTDLYLGLFTSVSGVVKNLTVQADYRITLNVTENTRYNIYVGGIAACSFDGGWWYFNYTIIENVTVDLSAVLIINGNNDQALGANVTSGGLCGDVVYYAKDVNVTTYISLTNNCNAYAYIGGLYGGYDSYWIDSTERCYIENADVTFTCDINAPYRVEGRIGGLSGFLRNCIVSGASIKSEITGSVESCEVIMGGVSADSSIYGDGNSFELYDVTSSMTAEFTITCEYVDIEHECGYYGDEYGNNFGGEWGVYKVEDADVQIEYGDFTIVQWNSIIENCSAETTVTVK